MKTFTLLTGVSRGLGRGLSRALAGQGRELVLTARDVAAAAALAKELGGRHLAFELDVTRPPHAEALVGELQRLGARLDCVVHNAGVYLRGASHADAVKTLETNFFGPLHLDDALSPVMTPDARVVFVSSGLGRLFGYAPEMKRRFEGATRTAEVEALAREFLSASVTGRDGRSSADATGRAGFSRDPYAVSKALLDALARARAREFPSRTVVSASPGWVQTDMGGRGAPLTLDEGVAHLLRAVTGEVTSGTYLPA